MPFKGDAGNVAAAGLQGGWDALAQLIAERKKDELLRYTQEQDRLQFQQTQAKMDETSKWQQLQFEANERDRAERRALAAQTQTNLERLRADQNTDRDIAQTVRTYRDVPGNTKITSGTEFGKLQQAGLTPQLTWDPIEEGRPQSWTYQGGADWQQKEAAADAKVTAREDSQAAALERGMMLKGLEASIRAGQGLTQNQLFAATERLAGDWTKATAPAKDTMRQMAVVDAGLGALARGDRNAASQTLVVAFNKLIDDISVVREGEFIRTTNGGSLLNRLIGAREALVRGGVKMSDPDLHALARMAKDIGAEVIAANDLPDVRRRIASRANRYGIHEEDVFGEDRLGLEQAPAIPPPAAPTVTPPGAAPRKFKIERVE